MNKAIVGWIFGFVYGVMFCCTSALAIGLASPLPEATNTYLPTNTRPIYTHIPTFTEFPTTISIERGMTIVSDKMTQTILALPTMIHTPTVTSTPTQNFDNNEDGEVTCADFENQEEAREALNAGYENLDGERDGIPCEDLPE